MSSTSVGVRLLRSSSTCLLLVCIPTIAVCSACRYDTHYGVYSKEPPPRDRLCGVWVIDSNRTEWKAARPLLENGRIGPNRGYLQIWPDGRFNIAGLPDFSIFYSGPIPSHVSASGKWQIKTDVMTNWAYLWLEYDSADILSTKEKHAALKFLPEGEEVFLHVTIGDPDQGDVLIMRKTDKPLDENWQTNCEEQVSDRE